MANDNFILKMEKISKRFPGVQALDEVDFYLKHGEVHALLGENGAGKSTLMNVLNGIHKRDVGTITFQSKEVVFNNPSEAQKAGLAIIHQELELIPYLTVAENIFLGREPKKGVFVDYNNINQMSVEILDKLGVKINPKATLNTLNIGSQQMVEIAKAVSQNAEILVMDEPTSSLTQQEIDILFNLINRLKKQGISIIYISHRLEEVFEICDRVTVLRDGKNAGQAVVSETKRSELIKMMVGREIGERFPALGQDIGEELLKVENLKVPDKIEKVNFTLHRGEVIGIAGLMGAGRTELAKSLFGVFKPTEGQITYKGEKLTLSSPKEAIQKGIYYLSEDRKGEGLITILSVQDNITLSILRDILQLKIFINSQTEKETALKYIKDLNIKTPSEKQLVKNLSGGNQQKVVVSKVLSTNPEIIIMDDPTRGIDVGAKQEIYEIIRDLTEEKVGIILISSELPEVINMSHQVIVLHEKKMKGMINSAQATQQNIMELATGGGKSG